MKLCFSLYHPLECGDPGLGFRIKTFWIPGVTYIFLLKNYSTPTRLVSLRLLGWAPNPNLNPFSRE